MKKLVKQTKGLIKGRSTAFLVSVGIHAALLLAAGTMVVFHVVKKKEIIFEQPKVEQQKKINLKKPRVKVKKQTRPKSSKTISTKSVQTMSDFQLPAVSSMGEGLGGGIGGIELMPDIDSMTILGAKESVSVGNDFVGTFYDLRRDRRGKTVEVIVDNVSFSRLRRQFFESGWNPNILAQFYRHNQKLYTTFFYLPMIAASIVPRSFGIPDEVYGEGEYLVHFKGQFAAKESGRYRFWGRGENFLDVRVNGKIVLMGGHTGDARRLEDIWKGTADEHRKYWRGHGPMGVGDWFELEAGVPVDMEVMFGDDGEWTQCTLTIQKEGEYYTENPNGAPILPVFKTAPIPEHLKDQIRYRMLTEGGDAADLDSPVMFNMY